MKTLSRSFRPLAVACAILLSPALAAQAPSSSPAADPLAAKVDAIFAAYAKTDVPGCAVGVYRDGKIAFAKGYGAANLEHGIPITPKTVFYIGSVSKQFTAAAVALLARQGKISLDDDVRKHVPEVPDFGTPITIRHLIHHTSGLKEKWALLAFSNWRDGDLVTLADMLDLIRRQKGLNFKPGDEHLYSNTGYDLLAIVVERASGKPLREYARENLFAPLGMNETRFVDDRTEILPRRAAAYAPRQEGGFAIDVPHVETVGSGGLYSTIEDLARWDGNFVTGRVGGPEWLEQIQTPGTVNDGTKLDYAFGLGVDEDRGLRRVWHNGALAAFRAFYGRYPDEHLSVALLCNDGSVLVDTLAGQVADVYLAGRFKESPPPPAPPAATVRLSEQDLTRVTGSYLQENPPTARRILVRDGKLFYHRGPGNESELSPLAADIFALDGGVPVRFLRGDDGRITGLRIDTAPARDVRFARQGG
jgi:CubicO group peptidase (beta-lactamase class C family)